MRETTDEFGARGMRLWREQIQAGIRRMQENGAVWQSVEYVCYDEPVRTRICETCEGTGFMHIDFGCKWAEGFERNGRIKTHVECPFGCEREEDA